MRVFKGIYDVFVFSILSIDVFSFIFFVGTTEREDFRDVDAAWFVGVFVSLVVVVLFCSGLVYVSLRVLVLLRLVVSIVVCFWFLGLGERFELGWLGKWL